jgi:cell division protein FtsQ
MKTLSGARRLARPPAGRRGWKTVQFLLLMVLIGELGMALWSSPALRVRHLVVEGIALTRPEQVVREAGIGDRSSWVFLPTARVAHRIQRLPTVLEAVVRRGMPGTVYITVFERQPIAVLSTVQGNYWVDVRGVPFWKVEGAGRLPVVRVEAPLSVVYGRAVRSKPVQTALEILYRYVPEYGLPVVEIVVDGEGNLCLNMREGLPPVKAGDSSDLPRKMELLAHLWSQPQIVRHAEYLDLSCAERPVWKPHGQKKGAL